MKNERIIKFGERRVPKGWSICFLPEIAQLNPPKPPMGLISDNLEVSFIPMKDVEKITGNINLSETRSYFKVRKNYTYFRNGDIIFAKITPCMENGKVAIAAGLKNEIGFGSTEFHVIRLKHSISQKFYFLYFVQDEFRKKAQEKMTGTAGQVRVPLSYLENTQIPLPPLNEQKRIVSKIEAIFSHIDILEKSLKSVKSQMGQYKQLVLKLAFEGKLVLQKPDTSWRDVKISEICELIGGGTPSRKQPKYFGGDIVWLTPTEISKTKIVLVTNSREKITKRGLERSSAKIIPKDAVLFTSRASIGYVAIAGTNLSTNQGFMSFVCSHSIHNYFLAYWLVSNKRLLKQSASGTTFKEISKSKMREFSILMPSIPEQKRIVSKIKSIFAHIDMTDEHITRLQTTLATLRQSVLQHAFEGNLVSQDPNDEPAYKLLEQIEGRT